MTIKSETTLCKGMYFTDLHFGKKGNSTQHNQDCLNYIDWLCNKVVEDCIDFLAFLGDWHENRSALNVSTLNSSYEGIKKLDALGIPIFFVVGNHDLYFRHSREIHSVEMWSEFPNVQIINSPTVIDSIGDGVLFVPFMFPDEYPSLVKYNHIPFWAGHFEFQGFVITGYNMKMQNGPTHVDFGEPNLIVSGHFHRRQSLDNVVYIGNAFPMDFGDANDSERGCMVYDHTTNEMYFHNWDDCPKYIKTYLSKIQNNTVVIPTDARVKCVVDDHLTYEESNELKQQFMEEYSLREFDLTESDAVNDALQDTDTDIDIEELDLADVDELVIQMLKEISSKHIDNDLLIDIYLGLNCEK